VSDDRVKAVILAVGSEMLTPTRADTNSLFITDVLNGVGIAVAYKAVVRDDREEIGAHVDHALGRHSVLILSGGLGPTDDDLTREVVAGRLGLPLEEDPAIVEWIRQRFASRGMTMPENNRRQAQVPRGAQVLVNPRGSAPGLLIEPAGKIVVLLPGPPREMQPMMSGVVRDRLRVFSGGRTLLRRVLRVGGRAESRVDEMIQPTYAPWFDADPPIETTILASPGVIELQLSSGVADVEEGARRMDEAVDELRRVLGPDLISADNRPLEQVAGDLLRERNWRVALAESCTGGLATSRLTDVAGSSDYVDRSVVVYSNQAKQDLLGVDPALIGAHGAVSEAVALAMAEAVRARSGTEFGVAITGIAGPGGGTDAKPVGTVWIAVAGPGEDQSRAIVCRFLGSREMVKVFAAMTALDLLRRRILGLSWDIDWVKRS
jgi:nicotinamide-nucleotide amidase